MKGGIGWKLIALALDRDPWKLHLMFLFLEIDIKLYQIYTKIHMCKILKIWNLNHVTRTTTNDSAVHWSHVSCCITWPLYCTASGGFLVKQYWRINAKENRIYIRGEFKESLGMNFFQSLSAWKGVQTVQIM